MKCKNCGKELSYDEIGLCRKLIGRNTEEFYCLLCMAKKFDVEEERLREKIEEFRASGCLLFLQNGSSV